MSETSYTSDLVDRLEILWGEGFLSPGGAAEVRSIVAGIDLENKSVLDIGCGTGGVDIVLAGELKAASVEAIDIQPNLIHRASSRLASSRPELADRINFQLVSPGPLDWPDATFDVVFTKETMIRIADKQAMFDEILRVLKPGGVFVASDWLGSDNTASSADWRRLIDLTQHNYHLITPAEVEAMLRTAGFAEVSTRDRNAWYAECTRKEVENLEGPLREKILELVDEPVYRHWLDVRRALRDSVNAGAMRPTHLRGFKPT